MTRIQARTTRISLQPLPSEWLVVHEVVRFAGGPKLSRPSHWSATRHGAVLMQNLGSRTQTDLNYMQVCTMYCCCRGIQKPVKKATPSRLHAVPFPLFPTVLLSLLASLVPLSLSFVVATVNCCALFLPKNVTGNVGILAKTGRMRLQ